MMNIIKFAPALQVVIPLFAALISALSFHRFSAWIIAIVSTTICLILSLYCMQHINISNELTYSFGGWEAPIGIEYRLDHLNQPIIVLLNIVLFFFLVFGKELIEKTVTPYIEDQKQHLFYTFSSIVKCINRKIIYTPIKLEIGAKYVSIIVDADEYALTIQKCIGKKAILSMAPQRKNAIAVIITLEE